MATLADGANAIQDGSAFRPPPGVDDLFSLGLSAAESVASQISEIWTSASSNLSTTLSVTSSKVKVTELKAKSEGRTPSKEELDEACGPLAFLSEIPKALNEALGGITSQVQQFASDFGRAIGEFESELNELISDVANAVDETAEAIAQAALDAFEAANTIAIQALNAVNNAINEVVGAVNTVISQAEAALDSAINELLAFADGLTFAGLFSLDCQDEAVENTIDEDKVADAAEVDRVIGPEPSSETNDAVDSENLSTSKTEFTQVQSAPPPDIDELIQRYRSAAIEAVLAGQEIAIAFTQKRPPTVSRAQRDALNITADLEKNNLFLEAASLGIDVRDLPIYGPSFDQPLTAGNESTGQNNTNSRAEDSVQSERKRDLDALNAAKAESNKLIAQFNSVAAEIRQTVSPPTSPGYLDRLRVLKPQADALKKEIDIKDAEIRRLSAKLGKPVTFGSVEAE